ncbi:MAG: hypothetical protein AAFN77_08995 [Planctomycetota bacterium]
MGSPHSEQQLHSAMDPVLGHLNFGSGSFEANFFRNLNALFGILETDPSDASQNDADTSSEDGVSSKEVSRSSRKKESSQLDREVFQASRYLSEQLRTELEADHSVSLKGTKLHRIGQSMLNRLEQLESSQSTFRDASQCRFAVLTTFENVLPAYLSFHRDLLFHQSPDFLFNSFFVARTFELVLQEIGQLHLDSREEYQQVDRDRFAARVINRLNDFVGHRPVATLETQKIEPYAHEYFRPLPIFVRDVGVAFGPYQLMLGKALELIRQTNPHIGRAAHFSIERLDELSIDTRAFDFDHPINQRPNHHFGQWDEELIDGDGFFRRFIVHQVTLDALLERVEDSTQGEQGIDSEEAIMEAAAALACTMLMGSGISGSGPGTFDSNTTLGSLIPNIANYRDQFYDELLGQLSPAHQERLKKEAKFRHQPFGAVRQDLNARLARQRATQLVNCRLAAIFARMGYPEAAEQQSSVVPVASARIQCQIDCLLSAAMDCVDSGELGEAFAAVKTVMRRLKTAIECGAVVDPWNIIGFDAQYSLFPAIENSVRDHRVYDLLDNMDRVFGLLSRITSEAAAIDDESMLVDAEGEFHRIVAWWKKFAAHEVANVGAVDPDDLLEAATVVSQALNLWHKGGAAAGDMEFWAPHAELLDTPKAYALVIDALMQRDDYQTTSALLVHWISQSEMVPLEQGDSSFHNLLFRWIVEQKANIHEAKTDTDKDAVWKQIRKFHDFLEVNSEFYWHVPKFELGNGKNRKRSNETRSSSHFDELDEFVEYEAEDASDNLFDAAYDEFTFTDSTDDGIDGEIHDGGFDLRNDSLDAEAERIHERLEFLSTISAYWNIVAKIPLPATRNDALNDATRQRLQDRLAFTEAWVFQADKNREQLYALLNDIDSYQLKLNGSNREAMVQYDQQRLQKESLLEHTVNTCIDTENAIRMMVSVAKAIDVLINDKPLCESAEGSTAESPEPDDQRPTLDSIVNGGAPVVCLYAALTLNDSRLVDQFFEPLKSYLDTQTLLYVPLSKGGDPSAIVNARVIQTAVLELLERLPAHGLFGETYQLTKTALEMERNNPVSGGAVTEFDEIFEVAYTSMVSALVRSTKQLREIQSGDENIEPAEIKKESQRILFDCIEMLTESMLPLWLEHSRTLRLSVLEKVSKEANWERLVDFIRKYGEGLFTQAFFHLGNVRAILHQGVDAWLKFVEDSPEIPDLRLFDELGSELNRETAVRFLTIVLESVRENFNEYVDYNTTTTQSDHGDQLDSFLDFLRLRSKFDRICWHLKPVVWAHRILVHDQEGGVARMWRRSLTERVGPEADKYLERLEKLRQKYSIQMNSVARRLEGRFAHQLQIDRLRALVVPAMTRPRSRESKRAFELLQHEAQAFLRSTNGVGVDLPEWLAELENEVLQFLLPRRLRDYWHEPNVVESDPLPIADLREKLEQLPKKE